MRVQVVGFTQFVQPEDIPWSTDVEGGQALIELAGRNCYQSWTKPNPKTATNAGYVENILSVGHFSVIEHANVSFLIEGVSRSLSLELIRHRHLSPSQLSQRFVDSSNTEFAIHPTIEKYWFTEIDDLVDVDESFGDSGPYNITIGELVEGINEDAKRAYKLIADTLMRKEGLGRKQAREAARSVLPEDTATKLVMTGNLRTWRHFLNLRGAGGDHGPDKEIRALAVEIANQLTKFNGVSNVFADVEIYKHSDGDLAVRVGKSENG